MHFTLRRHHDAFLSAMRRRRIKLLVVKTMHYTFDRDDDTLRSIKAGPLPSVTQPALSAAELGKVMFRCAAKSRAAPKRMRRIGQTKFETKAFAGE